MARRTLPLTDIEIKKAKPKEKDYKLSDGGGLYLLVKTNGSKLWRAKYYQDKKEKLASFGKYPDTGLAQARSMLKDLKDDPSEFSLAKKLITKTVPDQHSFDEVAVSYFEFKAKELSLDYYNKQKRRYELYIQKEIGMKPINAIEKIDIITLIKNIEHVKTPNTRQSLKSETARIVFNLLEQIFTYALHNDLGHNSAIGTIDKRHIIAKKDVEHYKAITDIEGMRSVINVVFSYVGERTTRNALLFLALTSLRSINVRQLKWEYINFKDKVVLFPKEAMKTREAFRLPLTDFTCTLLEEMRPFTGSRQYVFCSMLNASKPMSENTLGYALKRMDIYNHTPHGFRSAFSTIAHERQKEHGFGSDVIEAQLAHTIANSVKKAYLRSDFLEERRKLVLWWEKLVLKH
jgi:integrase